MHSVLLGYAEKLSSVWRAVEWGVLNHWTELDWTGVDWTRSA